MAIEDYKTTYDYVFWSRKDDFVSANIEGVFIDHPKYDQKKRDSLVEYAKSLENPPNNFILKAKDYEELLIRINYWVNRGYKLVMVDKDRKKAEFVREV